MDEKLLLCYSDNQMNLSAALMKRDIRAFRNALQSNQADAEQLNKETSMSLFEIACQTPGCSEFINACIETGCDVNKLNPEYLKRPINFAVESLDYNNIAALVNYPTTNFDVKYEGQTPLNFLSQQITDDDFGTLSECIKLLIKRHADPNIPNQREITPILAIARNEELNEKNKEHLINYFLDYAVNIDLDSFRRGEARKVLSNNFPHLRLPSPSATSDQWNFTKLIQALQNEQEMDFLHGLSTVCKEQDIDNGEKHFPEQLFRDSDGDETLLIVAAKKGLVSCVERMLRLGADVNYKVRKNLSPIEAACKFGTWRILELFLKTPNINVHTDEPLLSIVVKKIGELVTNKCNYEKCFSLLLNHPDIDVDEMDLFDCSALHYAIRYNNHSAIAELLKRGAYVGVKNRFDRYSITDINPQVFEKHLDSCITTNTLRPGDDNFEIIYDYTNLVPSVTKRSKELKGVKTSNPSKAAFSRQTFDGCPDEMAPIEHMAQTSELRHLLKHPLIASFLFLKWHRLALIFYINFVLYSIFCLSLISYILLCYRQEATSQAVETLLYSISFILGICIFIREVAQLIMSPRNYLRNKENYLEIALIIMVAMILFHFHYYDESTKRTIAALTILLAVGEFFLLTGSLPVLSFSTHLVMLKTVAKSFFKSLLLYSIILIAFSLCFFTLLNETNQSSNERNANGSDANAEDDDSFNKFQHPGLAIIKTVVMLTGEFDAASINFKMNASSYLVFLIFVFLISTVLFNLLNGLAVSDTQAIKSEAELMNFIHRSELMARYESILLGKDANTCCNFFIKKMVRSRISLFQHFIPLYKVSVLPNIRNQVLIHLPPAESDNKLADIESNSKLLECISSCLFFGNRCSSMEPKIVKYSWKVLDKKVNDFYEEKEKIDLKNRILFIEKRLTDINDKLTVLLQK